ncbi:mechanosensitive ion channel-like protein [Balneicella halophila]|uniref:Mechanosensitive ion channel-like protein n=1 Tax=Balneicella halophila TaxID=1537566 RepID=A0A7L4URI1_BALHA|nr:mechanosensitive ion channel domain-containing protein [Balneicella halophila]PVX52269.1 mechanosensitive ion channel-like protein [Balneicella halophila]
MDDILNFVIISVGKVHVTVSHIVTVAITLLITKLIVWLFSKAFKKYSERKRIDLGRQHSIFQIIKYLIYFLAVIFIINSLHLGSSGLLISSGALLVGVGIGLQQTFNDIFSGILLLLEGSVKVNDKLIVDDIVCQVDKIGVRTTQVTTIDNISIIIPNSNLVTNKVINWSHSRKAARFHVDVGVSYGSDIDQVEKILLDSLSGQNGVERIPRPSVQLMNYGDSSVDFRLFFYSRSFFDVRIIKSDIRKKIFKSFKKEGIEIPFPQRDLWVKTAKEE